MYEIIPLVGIFIYICALSRYHFRHLPEEINFFEERRLEDPHLSQDLSQRQLEEPSNNFCIRGHQIPNVIFIGGMKCGTSTFASTMFNDFDWKGATLCNRTRVPYCKKEPHFFDMNNDIKIHDPRYAQLFPRCQKEQIVMDGTPANGAFLENISKMYSKEQKNELLFLKLVCNPTKRYESAWNHCVRLNYAWAHSCDRKVSIDEQAIMSMEIKDINNIGKGLYDEEMKTFRKYFPNSELILGSASYFYKNPGEFINVVLDKIGDKRVFLGKTLRIANKGPSGTKQYVKNDTKAKLRAFFTPYMEAFKNLIQNDSKLTLVPSDITKFMEFASAY